MLYTYVAFLPFKIDLFLFSVGYCKVRQVWSLEAQRTTAFVVEQVNNESEYKESMLPCDLEKVVSAPGLQVSYL